MSGSPVLGNYVDVGSNVCIIGDIYIGDHVTIGCGSVVTKTVPPDIIIAGNPAHEIKKRMEVIVA
jgi:putative colanic acid biosynthesis acetyltransferase WcaB